MKRLALALLLVSAPAFAGNLRLFNPRAEPVDAVLVCDGVESRQAVAPQAIVDVAGDCVGGTGLLILHTDTVDGVDVQTLDAAATAECPTPALFLPLTGCRFGSVVATVNPVDGAIYSWTIEGGTLLSGAGTERVLIGIGSGLTLKVTATISSPSCGVRNAAGVMALRDPFTVKSLSAGGAGAAGQSRTITWSYDNGAPLSQILSGSDFGPVTLPAAARSYTYTPSLYGDKSVVLQASTTTTAVAARTRAAGRGTAAASSCSGVRAEAKYHVDCSTPVVSIDAPAATGVGIPFTARVKLAPGTSASWTIANGTPSTATGDSVSIVPTGGAPVDIHVTVAADSCTATAAAHVNVDSSLGCVAPPTAKLALTTSDCDRGIITISLTGTPPFSGTWNDGQGFSAIDRVVERTVFKAGDYTIKNFHDALCSGLSDSVKYSPTPTATISTNGVTCLTGGNALAILTFTGTPPFLGEWSDSIAFNTNATRLERKITAPADLTLKWFQDANCLGTVSGHAGFGEPGTADLKMTSPANGCLMFGDPATPFATAAVDLTGTPPFTVTWSDGFEQNTSTSPALRPFPGLLPGATYPFGIKSARDAYCDLKIVNASTAVTVTRYPAISGPPSNVCPGTVYTASVPFGTPLPVTWHIDKGSITAGQGTQTISFMPDGLERTVVTLSADVADPATCNATSTKVMKIQPNAAPVQVTVSPSTIHVGESATITVAFDLATTESIRGEWAQLPGWVGAWSCIIQSPCSYTMVGHVPSTVEVNVTGYPYCNKLTASHASATITVLP
jgi:hypothetical protein